MEHDVPITTIVNMRKKQIATFEFSNEVQPINIPAVHLSFYLHI